MKHLALLSFLTIVFSGCAAPSQYAWGSYEELIYVSYAEPGSVPPERQLELLAKDYEIAKAKNKPVPPGWHAHLGYVFAQMGRMDEARGELLNEKSQYPESAVMVDSLLKNMEGK
jgi:hypothetical protein